MYRVDSKCKAIGYSKGTVIFKTKLLAQQNIADNMSHGKNDTGSPWDYTFRIVKVKD